MDFDLEETMRKHDETLRHYRERVEQDQRDAGLLLAGATLPDYGVPQDTHTPRMGAAASQFGGGYTGGTPAAPPTQERYQPPRETPQREMSYDLMGFGGGGGGGFDRDAYHAPSAYAGAAPYGAPVTPGRQDHAKGPGPARPQPAPQGTPSGPRGGGAAARAPVAAEETTPMSRGGGGMQTRKSAHPLRVYERVSQWQRRKQQKLEEERRKTQYKELENCPFEPVTRSTKMQQPWEQKSGSIYGGNGRAWGYDEFVERQREARRRSNEKKDVGKTAGKNWKNEVTVCQEFQLGRRDKSVRALQKPLSPPTFVPSVSEHHHLVKEIASLSGDSPLTQLCGPGLPQRGLFSERISTAIIDNTMLHPQDMQDGANAAYAQQDSGHSSIRQISASPHATVDDRADSEWARRSAEKSAYEQHAPHMYR